MNKKAVIEILKWAGGVFITTSLITSVVYNESLIKKNDLLLEEHAKIRFSNEILANRCDRLENENNSLFMKNFHLKLELQPKKKKKRSH